MKTIITFLTILLSFSVVFAGGFNFTVVDLNLTNGSALHLADINGDTYPDIVAGGSNPEKLYVFLNDGSGNFNPNADSTYEAPNKTHGIDTGDFNEDGQADVVISGRLDSLIFVYFGQGNGLLGSRLDINTSCERVYDVAAADVDNDQHLDIVAITKNDYRLIVLKGDGAGNFQPQAEYPLLGMPSEIRLVDLNNDTFLDVVQSDDSGNRWRRYPNDGSGGFPTCETISAAATVSNIEVVDMDSSGSMDLVWGSEGVLTNNLGIHLNAGSTITAVGPITPAYGAIRDICVADFNNDSKLDVFSINNNGAYITQTDGAANFTTTDSILNLVGRHPKSVAAADLDKDGRMDAVINQWDSLKITVLYNNGTTFVPNEPQPVLKSFLLQQNYPNPFNPSTTIRFVLPRSATVQLGVFNLSGQLVATLADGYFSAGEYAIDFDARNLSSGLYFYRLQTDDFSQTRKMLFVK